jgi:hypothetical protein
MKARPMLLPHELVLAAIGSRLSARVARMKESGADGDRQRDAFAPSAAKPAHKPTTQTHA